jgi:S1-C subfamily serine protease
MGVLVRLLLASVLVSCSPTETCKIKIGSISEITQQASLFGYSAKKLSREAAVEITSIDSMGNQVSGSGAYIVHHEKHYILTAAHVVSGSPVAMIKGIGETLIGDVVFSDPFSDVALISIKGMMTRSPIVWRVSDKYSVGDNIVYSGYPNSLGLLTIEGKIAGYDGGLLVIHSYVWRGSSGSAVLDSRGRIIGIVSAVDVGSDIIGVPTIIEDVGIVVPVRKIQEFFENK